MGIGRYVSHGFVAVLAIPAALIGMQLPALTEDYETGLVQSAREVRRLIDEHETIVRGQYHIDAIDDGGITEALRRFEPAHSEALAADVAHWRGLEAASQRIDAVSPVFQPFAALLDLADDPNDERRAVWRTSRDRFTPRLTFDMPALVYGFGGLMLGVLSAQLVLGFLGLFRRRRRPARA